MDQLLSKINVFIEVKGPEYTYPHNIQILVISTFKKTYMHIHRFKNLESTACQCLNSSYLMTLHAWMYASCQVVKDL